MDIENYLDSLLQKQRELVGDIDILRNYYNNNSIEKENEKMKLEIEKLHTELEVLNQKYKDIYSENQDLKVALREQVFNEKLSILKISKKNMETYFEGKAKNENNRLSTLEANLKQRVSEFLDIIKNELAEDEKLINLEVVQMHENIKERLKNRKFELAKGETEIKGTIETGFGELSNEKLDEETIKKRVRQNNVEVKIGLNIINKLGLGLIILGAATAAKYTYSLWFNNYIKGLSMFILGILFIIAGEMFSKKEKTVFSLGLNAGGTSILYFAVFNCYFILEVMSLNSAMFISILITIITTIFSLRYNSKTICSYALIGGYLPFFSYVFSFGLGDKSVIAAMAYLFLLNSSLLFVSLHKRWIFTEYLSFILNVPVLVYLINISDNAGLNIFYCFMTFALYLAITLVYSLRNNTKLRLPDILLLGFNTYVSCIVIYWLFEKAGFENLHGVLAIIFCIVYFGLGTFIEKYMKQEKNTKLLFYITSLAFAVLTIPFQFGFAWLSMGWIIESIILITYGLRSKSKAIELGGWIVFGLCYGTFLQFDILNLIGDSYIHLKSFSITLGMIFILFTYLSKEARNDTFKYSKIGKLINLFKYITIVHTWLYLIFETKYLYNKYVQINNLYDFYGFLSLALITMIFAYSIKQIKLIKDKVVDYISLILFVLSDLLCLGINLSIPVIEMGGAKGLGYIALVLLLAYNVFTFFNIKSIIMNFISRKRFFLELYPLILAVYILFNMTVLLVVQSNFKNINFIVSFMYMVMALLFLIYGFRKKYVYIRRLGLGLSIFANLKLFAFDISFLSMLWRIVAFFVFGFIMLGISYVYQKLKKIMESGKNEAE